MSTSSKSDKGQPNIPKDPQMQELRDLLLGKDGQHVKNYVKTHARELVGSVVIEALNDRQKVDDSLNQVLQPTVEKSVEASIKNHSDQFVGHLYPLVGRLVRKSVTAFLSEFLEKTNQLLENSLTPKGISWRLKAWHSGVSFSQYVASQTFVFRVEQVLLIHPETGILLNSVSNDQHQGADADLVSGMLTAINDFVADSFNTTSSDSEQNLAVVKTEDFSLVIKRGPQLVLVAAFTGNIPQNISTKFQITIEQIHSLYSKEIAEFEGNTIAFETTEPLLRSCLLSELKPEHEGTKKYPVLALIFVLMIFVLGGYYAFKRYEQNSLHDLVMTINKEPGMLVTKLNSGGFFGVQLELLRDPHSQTVESWLAGNDINLSKVTVLEKHYLSLEPQMVKLRIAKVLEKYPQITLEWAEGVPKLQGRLANARRLNLTAELMAIPGLTNIAKIIESVEVEELNTLDDDSPEILNALFEISSAKIENTQIEYKQGQSELTEEAKRKLDALANYMSSAIILAKKLDLNVGLVVMGASDSTGTAQFNQALSRKRAQIAQQYLSSIGIDPGYLNAIGLGVVEIKATGVSARKVIFNVVKFKTE